MSARLYARRTDIPKAQFWKGRDGRRIAAVYASDPIGETAVVLVPADASAWEENTAAAIADRAYRAQSTFELIFADELPPAPTLVTS